MHYASPQELPPDPRGEQRSLKSILNQAEDFPPLSSLPLPDAHFQRINLAGKEKGRRMNPLIQLRKQLPYLEVLATIIAVPILQSCAATTTTTQCAKPTLTRPAFFGTADHPFILSVTIETATT